MIEFLNMGGYALFVWGAYAVATLLVPLPAKVQAKVFRLVRQ